MTGEFRGKMRQDCSARQLRLSLTPQSGRGCMSIRQIVRRADSAKRNRGVRNRICASASVPPPEVSSVCASCIRVRSSAQPSFVRNDFAHRCKRRTRIKPPLKHWLALADRTKIRKPCPAPTDFLAPCCQSGWRESSVITHSSSPFTRRDLFGSARRMKGDDELEECFRES